jgi:hypothetical protein
VTYDRVERDGTLTVFRTEQGSYSYSEHGDFSMENGLLIEHTGTFSRATTGTVRALLTDSGTYDRESSSGSYSVYADTLAKDIETITDGSSRVRRFSAPNMVRIRVAV